ncbi:MAG: hypothetical protein DSM106950_28345 [Stigonema ocellatum SAG 48.90 = DSM 106950]|nr:hypothetical protein [Stigonema ocellatum SAG 48.90 = DSM 106950]
MRTDTGTHQTGRHGEIRTRRVAASQALRVNLNQQVLILVTFGFHAQSPVGRLVIRHQSFGTVL